MDKNSLGSVFSLFPSSACAAAPHLPLCGAGCMHATACPYCICVRRCVCPCIPSVPYNHLYFLYRFFFSADFFGILLCTGAYWAWYCTHGTRGLLYMGLCGALLFLSLSFAHRVQYSTAQHGSTHHRVRIGKRDRQPRYREERWRNGTRASTSKFGFGEVSVELWIRSPSTDQVKGATAVPCCHYVAESRNLCVLVCDVDTIFFHSAAAFSFSSSFGWSGGKRGKKVEYTWQRI